MPIFNGTIAYICNLMFQGVTDLNVGQCEKSIAKTYTITAREPSIDIVRVPIENVTP